MVTPPATVSARRLAIPAAVTLGSVVCAGAAAYQLVTAGWNPAAGTPADPAHVSLAAWFLMLGQFFDLIDGLVARALNATSTFGLQLDSLADFLSFGATAALLLVVAGNSRWATAAGLVVVCCAAVRVARYNVEKPPDVTPLAFKGLTTPGAGGAIASWVLVADALDRPNRILGMLSHPLLERVAAAMYLVLPVLAVLLAGLMISDRRYPDVTKLYVRGLLPRWPLAALAVLGTVTAPSVPFAIYYLGYAVRGLFGGRFDGG